MKIYGNDLGLDSLGLYNLKNVHRNLSVSELVDDIVNNNEGLIGLRGAAMVDTGIYTGRSPQDKYIVDEDFYSDYNDALITFKEAKKQIQKDERKK